MSKTDNDHRTLDNKKEGFPNPELDQIADWIKKLKFKKQLIGGANMLDVWNKLEELNSMYEEALKNERVRYDTLLNHYKESQEDKNID